MLDFLSDNNGASSLSVQNKDIYAELLKKAKKLNKLKEKVVLLSHLNNKA